MKKLIILALILVLAGCFQGQNSDESKDVANFAEEEEPRQVLTPKEVKESYETYEEARSKNDISKCEKIKDMNLKLNCLDEVYLKLSFENNDPSYCEKIAEGSTRDECESYQAPEVE